MQELADGMGMSANDVEVDSEDEFLDKRSIGVSSDDTELISPDEDLALLRDEEDDSFMRNQEGLQGSEDLATIFMGHGDWDDDLDNETPEILPDLRITNWLNDQRPNAVVEDVHGDPEGDVGNEISACSSVPATMAGGISASGEISLNAASTVTQAKAKSKNSQRKRKALCNICNKRFVHLDVHKKYIHCSPEEKEALKQECIGCRKKFLFLNLHMRICRASVSSAKRTKSKGIHSKPAATAPGTTGCTRNRNSKGKLCNVCNQRFIHLDVHQKYMHCTAEEKEALKQLCTICNKKFRFLDSHIMYRHPPNTNNVKQLRTSKGTQMKKETHLSQCTVSVKEKPKNQSRQKKLCNSSSFNNTNQAQTNEAKRSCSSNPKKVCSVCNRSISAKHFLGHYRNMHGTVEEKPASNKEQGDCRPKQKTKVCSVCNRSISAHNFRRHYRNLHGTVEKNPAFNREQGDFRLQQKKNHPDTNMASHTCRTHSLATNRKQKHRMVKCTRCFKTMTSNNLWYHMKMYHGTHEDREALREIWARYAKKLREAKIKKATDVNSNLRTSTLQFEV